MIVPILILGWIFAGIQRQDPDALQRFWERPKDWSLLTLALGCVLLGTCLSFVRWFILVRALGLRFRLLDAFRLGFVGYLFNFVGPSAVGGDLLKAYLVARDQKARRTEAVATILLDRISGLLGLLCLSSVTLATLNLDSIPQVASFLRLVWLATAGGFVVCAILLLPRQFSDWLSQPLSQLPVVGKTVERLASVLELYRQKKLWLLAIGLLSVAGHLLVAFAIHWSDRAIHPNAPTLREHVMISTLATAASGLPLPGGLGTYEFAMDYSFRELPETTTEVGQGIAVALCYRLITVCIAAIGVVFYWLNRNQVREAVHELESETNSS